MTTNDEGNKESASRQGNASLVDQYRSGTLEPPVRPGFLLFALFGTIILVAGLLFLANNIPGLAGFVDAPYFQLILTVLVSLAVGVFIFGFTAGATARMNLGIGKKLLIDIKLLLHFVQSASMLISWSTRR